VRLGRRHNGTTRGENDKLHEQQCFLDGQCYGVLRQLQFVWHSSVRCQYVPLDRQLASPLSPSYAHPAAMISQRFAHACRLALPSDDLPTYRVAPPRHSGPSFPNESPLRPARIMARHLRARRESDRGRGTPRSLSTMRQSLQRKCHHSRMCFHVLVVLYCRATQATTILHGLGKEAIDPFRAHEQRGVLQWGSAMRVNDQTARMLLQLRVLRVLRRVPTSRFQSSNGFSIYGATLRATNVQRRSLRPLRPLGLPRASRVRWAFFSITGTTPSVPGVLYARHSSVIRAT
jgi:hypothetical protein